MMAGLLQRLTELSLTTSVVLLPLLLLADWMERRYRAESRALLWLLLSLWLLLPVRWTPPEKAVLTLPVPELTQIQEKGAQLPQMTAQDTSQTPVPAVSSHTWTWEALVPWLWAAGCGGMLLWQGAGAFLLRRNLLRSAEEWPEDQGLLAKLWQGAHGRPRLLRTEAGAPPLSMGLFRPVLLMPTDLMGEEYELVLRHELAHIRRHDLWYKALLNLTNAVHWFNPLVWGMVRRAGRDLELCCDNAVVEGQDAGFRHRYGGVLLQRAARRAPGSRCAALLSGEAREMKGRIMNLFTAKKTGTLLVGLCLCAAVLLGVLVTFGRAQAQTENLTTQEALDALAESVTATDKEISFTIPATFESAEDWRIQISGQYQMGEDGAMSIHLIDNDGSAGRWKEGDATYSVPLSDYDLDCFDSLTLWASLTGENGEELDVQVDILDKIAPDGNETTATQTGALQWPLPGYTELSMVFGTRVHPITGRTTSHDGVDIPAPGGTPVLAVASGQVAETGWDESDGNYVLLAHDGDRTTRYGHLASVSVATGDAVSAGQTIGTVGATGTATGAHLHLEIAVEGVLTDPLEAYPSMDFHYR